MHACPTGAIAADRFLLHAERCLVFHNERPGTVAFPEWIPPSSHGCLVGCMKCQEECPENAGLLDRTVDEGDFSEEDTAVLLDGVSDARIPADLRQKLQRSDLLCLFRAPLPQPPGLAVVGKLTEVGFVPFFYPFCNLLILPDFADIYHGVGDAGAANQTTRGGASMKKSLVKGILLFVFLCAPLLSYAAPTPVTLWDFLSGGDGVRWRAMLDAFNSSQKNIVVNATTLTWVHRSTPRSTPPLSRVTPRTS